MKIAIADDMSDADFTLDVDGVFDPVQWIPSTTYSTLGELVSNNGLIYELVQISTGDEPVVPSEFWLNIGSINKMSIFDHDLSRGARSNRDIVFRYVLKQDINVFWAMGVHGENASIEVIRGGVVTESFSESVSQVGAESPHDYFNKQWSDEAQFIYNITANQGDEIVFTVTSGGGSEIKEVALGYLEQVGIMNSDFSVSMFDYSVTDVSDFGSRKVLKRGYSLSKDFTVEVDFKSYDETVSILNEARQEACIFVGSDALKVFMSFGILSGYNTDDIDNYQGIMSIESMELVQA